MIRHTMVLLCASCVATSALAAPDLAQSLAGAWTGNLAYRDYGNDRQVTLPTTVTFSGPATALRGDYVYDDGPGKTVRSSEHWSLAPDGGSLILSTGGTPARVTAYRDGPGADLTLEVEGSGEENSQAVAMRTLVTRSGDTLTITRLTQLPGRPWLTRHVYRFVKDK